MQGPMSRCPVLRFRFKTHLYQSMSKLPFTQPYAFTVGIDVSKESPNACLIRTLDGQVFEQKFNNNPEGYKKMKIWLRQQGAQADSDMLACMEHTDLYTRRPVH